MKKTEELSVLVTGGGSGLGAGIARRFLKKVALVTICGRREDKLLSVAKSLGKNCFAKAGDITLENDRTEIIQAALSHGGKLDVLVNNAGNIYRGDIDQLEQKPLVEIFNTNVIAGMLLSGKAKKELGKTQGSILFIGSVHTRRAFPGASAYAATKGAIEAITKALAAELGPAKIRVNCLVPGAVPTEIYQRAGLMTEEESRTRLESLAPAHALGRIGTEEEIAEAAEYLTLSEWTTGSVLIVDGGLSLGITNA